MSFDLSAMTTFYIWSQRVKAVGVVGAEAAAVIAVVAVDVSLIATARPARRTCSFGHPFQVCRDIPCTSSDSEKKVHQGWGGDEGTSELKAEAGAAIDAAAENGEWGATTDADAWGAPSGEAPATEAPAADGEKGAEREGRKPREPEEEDNTLTLDEYRKKQAGLEIVPKLEVRKVDDSAFKDAVVVTKKDEEESAYFVGKVRGVSGHSTCRLMFKHEP